MERELIGWELEDWLPHIEDSIRNGDFGMYNPTTVERQKADRLEQRVCPFCEVRFIVKHGSEQRFCSEDCVQCFNEYGAIEPRCIDFDAEDNM
jgi:hypothetical protein